MFEIVPEIRGEADAVVKILDELFDVVDLDGAEGAVGAFGVPAEAGVVRVRFAVPVLDHLHHHSEAAVPAVETRFQVVIMLDRPFPVDLLLQNRLNLLEGFFIDDRRVAAGVLDALECGDAGVVRVGEYRVDVADLDGLLGQSWCRDCGEAAADEFGSNGADGVLTRCVGVERPGDQWRAVLVDGDGAVLSTVLEYAGVEVADGCPADGAAVLHFLVHSFDDLVGEVSGVELSDR
nr:hypothetical protein [Subtercola sp. PAMC28395]